MSRALSTRRVREWGAVVPGIRCCPARAIPWQSHAVGRPGPWPPLRAQGIAPLQPCGGRARRAAAEYQPGYDGLPEGGCLLPPFTAVRIPGRMARPFEWATRRSRVGAGRFGTGRVGTGSGVPTRLRRVARRRAGPARPFASIAIRMMMTIRTVLDSTKLATKFGAKLEGNFQLPKNNNPVTFLTHAHRLPIAPRCFCLCNPLDV